MREESWGEVDLKGGVVQGEETEVGQGGEEEGQEGETLGVVGE